ncbi:TraB/GumN family protein [Tabrizicola sp. BL-A-41-H6]|uniref:TraB/GumN family protein n=1 Tax=Tabrizicola sp. BL-A-41-H6 TaxID=3421107 RepID=UPI003D665FF8
MTRILACIAALFLAASPLSAECTGENLLATMPAGERAALQAAANDAPYPTGNFWRATRGGEVITLIGTYHFDDPRHQPTLEAITPLIETATTVLVEAGPEEEAALLDMMARNPSLMTITEGPTLLEQMSPETWAMLSDAMSKRGVPGFMAAKLRPWYVNVLLAIPPCAMAGMTDPKGLDGMVIDTAEAKGVPVKALEPFDTVFDIFGAMTEAEQIAMIQATLLLEERSADFFITLADAYFAGESRLVWELMRKVSYEQALVPRAEVDAEFAKMEEVLMAGRNRAWIPVLEQAATAGPVLAAFGALHLPGDAGVLALLEAEGFSIEPLPL